MASGHYKTRHTQALQSVWPMTFPGTKKSNPMTAEAVAPTIPEKLRSGQELSNAWKGKDEEVMLFF